MAIATARPATITVRMTAAPAITMGPTTDHPITMNPRPALMLQTTIHTPAATNHPTLTTASGPQTDIVQTILFLAPIRTSAVTSRQILPAPLGHQI